MYCEIPDFRRCCFCMPLRRGVLVFGYLNILFSAFMVGVYSFSVHYRFGVDFIYHGLAADASEEICLAVYCFDVIFNVLLVYGAHKRSVIFIKMFYYYTLATIVSMVLFEIITIIEDSYFASFELLALFVLGVCTHIYLVFLVRSLLKKMEMSGHSYENQLHQIINGEMKMEGNGIYPSTVVPNETV